MQFQAVYEEKKMSAAEMAARIPDASHIFSDIFLAQPKTLYEAINNRCLADSMRSCTITTYLDLYPLVCYTEPIRFAKNLQGTSVFCSALTRKAVGQGLADYLPNTYWDQPALIREYLDVDVFVVSVSPMDSHGYFSLGVTGSDSAEYLKIECGAAENSCKAIHPGKTIATFAYGSKRMYDYIDHNPSVAILPVDYVNNPYTIAQNDNVVSVNAALEIDLSGQVCAESIGNHMFSGSGGQLDYVRGALMSRGGLSFIAFPSTAKGGTISKIKPFLAPGAGVTTGRNEVDMIVTEYGIAKLRGRTFSQRAKALISIAHPNFRDELLFEARKMGLML